MIDVVPPNIKKLIETDGNDVSTIVQDDRLIDTLRSKFKDPVFKSERPDTAFPELHVTVPDDWPSVHLAPLYDVHIGHHLHDEMLFNRHVAWIAKTPNVLTWDGGDMIENASKLSIGAGVYEQDFTPENQVVRAASRLAEIHHKTLFKLPGNHEDRTLVMGVDIGRWLAWLLGVPYFPDYCFLTIKYAGNNFRILAHHGTGAAQTAGGQTMAARKDISWAKPFDIYWTGHLHSGKLDVLYQTDFDQKTGLAYERNGLVIISPSYLKFFGGYGAKKRYSPGIRGLHAITLQKDGRIDVSIHANGRRL